MSEMTFKCKDHGTVEVHVVCPHCSRAHRAAAVKLKEALRAYVTADGRTQGDYYDRSDDESTHDGRAALKAAEDAGI